MNGQGPTAPATTPADNSGLHVRGKIQVNIAMKTLTQAVQLLGAETEDGRIVLEALAKLSKQFGEAAQDLTRQEIATMAENAAPAGPTPAGGMSDFRQMTQQRMPPAMMAGGPGG